MPQRDGRINARGTASRAKARKPADTTEHEGSAQVTRGVSRAHFVAPYALESHVIRPETDEVLVPAEARA